MDIRTLKCLYNVKHKYKVIEFNKLRCVNIPRNSLKHFAEDDLINKYGIYFLIDNDENSIYIGQSDNVERRVKEHNNNKEFNNIFIFNTIDNSFNRTSIDYLEFHYIEKIKNQNFWTLKNKEKREKEPKINSFDKYEILEMISVINIMLDFLGINLQGFITNAKSQKKDNTIDINDSKFEQKDEVFYCKDGKLIYQNGLFFILKDSLIFSKEYIDKYNSKASSPKWVKWRESVIKKIERNINKWEDDNWIKKYDENRYILLKDIEINSSSFAAELVKGATIASGWEVFKNINGESLGKVYRDK